MSLVIFLSLTIQSYSIFLERFLSLFIIITYDNDEFFLPYNLKKLSSYSFPRLKKITTCEVPEIFRQLFKFKLNPANFLLNQSESREFTIE
jgi:hypothetical protein